MRNIPINEQTLLEQNLRNSTMKTVSVYMMNGYRQDGRVLAADESAIILEPNTTGGRMMIPMTAVSSIIYS